jgi:ATP-binding protein involved in chromosome partitioning
MSVDDPRIPAIQQAISRMKDPETGRTLDKTGQIGTIAIDGSRAVCEIKLSAHSSPIHDEYRDSLTDTIRAAAPDLTAVEVRVTPLDRPPPTIGQVGLTIKSVIAVGSGKGGVGKSTLAASIALTLQKAGARVGLMDADVYGPSIPHLLGLSGRPEVQNGKIVPIYAGRMPVMSMGFLIDPQEAVVWRGPMLHGAITQFLRDTYWGTLDYLIIDMPPGTGDIALTLSQMLPLSGAVVVCTPQEVALLDAVKAIAMFNKTKIPLLGMVENMSGFVCPNCNKTYDIFGRGGAREKAEQLDVPFLGEVPLNIALRQHSDEGGLAQALEDPINAAAMDKIVRALVRQLARRAAMTPMTVPLPVLS